MARRRGLLKGLVAAALATSCGWHAGLTPEAGIGRQVEGGPSVGVEVFDVHRDVLERDLEPILHTELTRAVTELVDAPLASPREATLLLRGEIVEYRRRGGIRSIDNRLLETAVRIRVRAELVRRSTGQRVGESTCSGPFRPSGRGTKASRHRPPPLPGPGRIQARASAKLPLQKPGGFPHPWTIRTP